MAVPSIPRQRKISDAQFVGDLMSLFDRRGISSGDPQSLENFGSVLGSNDALRSDLFTLCTAISHMAESDLSGEQLLGLVARALAGYKLLEDDDGVQIPESMRSAFLTGYEAWSSRGSELNEPLPWPPPRPAQRNAPVVSPEPFDAHSEPIAPKVAARGLRTVQEALDLARERAPFDTPAHRPRPADTNIDNLNLDELKKLLEDILHRVSRIEPQPTQRTSISRSPIDDFARREDLHQSQGLRPPKTSVRAAESETGVYASLAQLVSSVIPEATARPAVEMSESAFLARHGYLKPPQRLGSDPFPTSDDGCVAPVPVPSMATPAANAEVAPLVGSETVADAAPDDAQSTPLRYVQRFIVRDSRSLRIVGGILASAIMIVIGYLGVVVYHAMHTRDVYAYNELESPGQSTISGQSNTPGLPTTETTTSSGTNGGVPRDNALSSPPASSANTTPQLHRTSPPTASPIYVRSSEMMGYALVSPMPVYSPGQAMRMDGTVVLQVTISKQGSVISTRIVSGPVAMRSEAVRAVRMWRFKPYLVNGYPTQVITTVELPYREK